MQGDNHQNHYYCYYCYYFYYCYYCYYYTASAYRSALVTPFSLEISSFAPHCPSVRLRPFTLNRRTYGIG